MYIVKKVIDYDQPEQKIYSQTLRKGFFFYQPKRKIRPSLYQYLYVLFIVGHRGFIVYMSEPI